VTCSYCGGTIVINISQFPPIIGKQLENASPAIILSPTGSRNIPSARAWQEKVCCSHALRNTSYPVHTCYGPSMPDERDTSKHQPGKRLNQVNRKTWTRY